jgi:arylformamidase
MKWTTALMGILTFSLAACSQSFAGPIRDKLNERALQKQAAGAEVKRDIAYGEDPLQRFDVYLPPNAKRAPVIFMVHGGAWRYGDKAAGDIVRNKATRWVPKGIIFVSVNYRLLPHADPLEQTHDVAKALAAAQTRAESVGGDPSRFLIMGHSAGAHLVTLLASDPAIAKQHGVQPWLGTVSLDTAALDVVAIMNVKHPDLYDDAFGSDPAFWRNTSPLHRLAGTPAPMLLVCSSERSDACPHAQRFADKAVVAGAKITVLPVALSHGEINEDLGKPGPYTDSVEKFIRSLGIEI